MDSEFPKEKINSIFLETVQVPNLSKLVSPESCQQTMESLTQLTGRLWLKRLFICLVKMNTHETYDLHCRQFYSTILTLSNETIIRLSMAPEVTSWVIQAESKQLKTDRINDQLNYLNNFFASYNFAEEKNSLKTELNLDIHEKSDFNFYPWGVGFRFFNKKNKRLKLVSSTGNVLSLWSPKKKIAEISLDELESKYLLQLNKLVVIKKLKRCNHSNIFLIERDGWYQRHFPTDPMKRSESPNFYAKEVLLNGLLENCNQALHIIAGFWPSGLSWLKHSIVRIGYVNSLGVYPNNYSLPSFRGFVAMGERPTYLASQSLLHEAAHNRMSSISEIFNLFKNEGHKFISPFVDQPRTAMGIFHGCMAFLQDVLFTRKILNRVPEIYGIKSMEEYIETLEKKILKGIQILKNEFKLTPDGENLVYGFEQELV